MNNPTANQPSATIGSCSCTVDGDPNFSGFVANRFSFVPQDAYTKWHVLTSNGNTGPHQILGILVPNEGNVFNKPYTLGPGSNVFVGYQSVIPGEQLPYTTTKGQLILSVDVTQKKLTATFDLTAVSGTRTVHLSQGKLEVQGYSDEPKLLGTGTVTASVAGNVTVEYQSTGVDLTDSPISSFPESFGALSQHMEDRPSPLQYFLSLRLAKALVPGTYAITRDSLQARATFIDATSKLDAYHADNGQVTVHEMPQNDPLAGTLRASFSCDALSEDGVNRVLISDGEINIKK